MGKKKTKKWLSLPPLVAVLFMNDVLEVMFTLDWDLAKMAPANGHRRGGGGGGGGGNMVWS